MWITRRHAESKGDYATPYNCVQYRRAPDRGIDVGMRRKSATEPPHVWASRLSSVLACVDGVPVRSLPFDEDWRARVQTRVAELGIKQSDLARWIRCTQPSVSHVLNRRAPRYWQSQSVERIATALRLELPLLAQWYVRGIELNAIDPDGLRAFLGTINWSTKKRSKQG